MKQREKTAVVVALPEPEREGGASLLETLWARRSVREYTREPLTLAEASRLLWAAQGITGDEGLRTAPSAGALYPLEVYLLAGAVEGLPQGLYRYRCPRHDLVHAREGDLRAPLSAAALDQECVAEAAAVVVMTGVHERITGKYGSAGKRYVYMEVGHASQNVYLEAVSLGLGTVVVGAFDEARVKKLLGLPAEERPLYLMPVGRPR